MRLSRLDVLMLVAGLGGMGACRGGRPRTRRIRHGPTTPAESTVFQAAAAGSPPSTAAQPDSGTGGPAARP
jgi:hypothetical protein